MKFGIFYEHQLPRPWGEKSEYQLLQDSLTQIELADRLGYDYAWEVEHHFLEEYSHSSAPEVFFGAASQRTKRIRLGHGVVQLTTNQPHRVAERVSTLDLLSGGRVDLLKTVKAPTLVLHGEEDPLLPVECGRDVAKLVPGAEIETIAGWGHDFPPQLVPRIVDRIAIFCKGK